MSHPYVKDTQIWVPNGSSNWEKGEVTSVNQPADATPETYITLKITYGPDQTTLEYSYPLSVLLAAGQSQFAPASPTSTTSSTPGGQVFSGKDTDGKPVPLPPLRNPDELERSEDLADLSNLNEPSVLHALKERYQLKEPYTYSGIVLVALNPFTNLNIYGPDMIQSYSGKKKGDLSPHVFAIAEDALECMRRGAGGGGTDATGAGDQTIVVSGESGAGKTVSAKYILRYFASVDDPSKSKDAARRQRARAGATEEGGMSETERQILASNPIMEAFGNAKTTRNDNSSRFGKYIEVLFDKEHDIVGARVRTYLLERSRLVYQPEVERNYHIFYQLLAGAPGKERKDLGLDRAPADFAYLVGGGPTATPIRGVDDKLEFELTQKALSTVGIAVERQWQIFRLLAALLHLGNVEVKASRNEASIDPDDASMSLATELLGVDKEEFKKWTVKKQLITRSEKIVTNLNAAQALVVRDSVAKFIYSCLFDWLVAVINESLAGGGAADRAVKFIGVLDIYGFEHFKKNSFEQFCINWANEKLQQEFNAHVFKLEQEEYVREEINWTFIDFADNQMCIDVIEGKMGILTLLDEESRLPAGADLSFAGKLFQQINKPEQKAVFKKPRFGQNAFTISHYAHDVTYDVDGFIEKNRDTVPDEHLALLQNSSNPLLKDCLEAALQAATAAKEITTTPSKAGTPTGPKRAGGAASTRKPTLGSIFKHSLINLMETINNTNVHYIRCIKPNEAKNAWEFDSEQVLSQLRACGVLETIKISCAGYPNRWTFGEFAERYEIFIPPNQWQKFQGISDLRPICTAILENSVAETDKYQIGLTKIFFRPGMVSTLDRLKKQRLDAIVTIVQKNYRRHVAQKHYQSLRMATIKIQSWRRGTVVRRLAEQMRKDKAAISIQSIGRMFLARKAYQKTRQAVVKIQSALRGYQARLQYKEAQKTFAAERLQSLIRGSIARKQYIAYIRSVVLLQNLHRRRLAKKELVGLKNEAKSANKFKEISYKLENKVVELTQTLQKRTAERKELQEKVYLLEQLLQSWMTRHEDSEAKSRDLSAELNKPTVPLSQFEQLLEAKRVADDKMEQAISTIQKQEADIKRMTDELALGARAAHERQTALEEATARTASDESTISGLRADVASLREQINRANALSALTRNSQPQPPPSPTVPHLNGGIRGLDPAPNMPSTRRVRRHSMTGLHANDNKRSSTDERMMDSKKDISQFRAVSMAMPTNGVLNDRDSQGMPVSIENTREAITRLLENSAALDEDVLNGLITQLKIVPPSLANPPIFNEVMFPSHLISLIANEMWKQDMIKQSERFLANVMQTIQQHVMSFSGEDIIIPGFFWLANIHELLSFVDLAQHDILQGVGPGSETSEPHVWADYERLVSVARNDLESLEYNIYHSTVTEIKKRLNVMIVPALIESQTLPGFVTQETSGRLLNRFITQPEKVPLYGMEELLELMNKVMKAMKSYHIHDDVISQVFISDLLKLIGVNSFNDMLMRRNFCSWKRAMQIQYNITRLEEWCKSNDVSDGTLSMESLMQATKLLQLKKATAADIDILFDVCWILSPSQIQKLISQYHVAAFEAPIAPDVLKMVSARVNTNDKGDHLLLPPEGEEAMPYTQPPIREILDIETYVPAYLPVPHVRRLAMYAA